MLSWSSIVLVHRNNISADRHVIPHGTHCPHSESTSPCFYSNSCVLAEKLQIHFCTNIIVKLNWPGFEPMIYYTWAKHISSHGYWQMLIDFFFWAHIAIYKTSRECYYLFVHSKAAANTAIGKTFREFSSLFIYSIA